MALVSVYTDVPRSSRLLQPTDILKQSHHDARGRWQAAVWSGDCNRPRFRSSLTVIGTAAGALRTFQLKQRRHVLRRGTDSGQEAGNHAAVQRPNDVDTDPEFTARFDAFVASYYARKRRPTLWRSALHLLICVLPVGLYLLDPTFRSCSGSFFDAFRSLSGFSQARFLLAALALVPLRRLTIKLIHTRSQQSIFLSKGFWKGMLLWTSYWLVATTPAGQSGVQAFQLVVGSFTFGLILILLGRGAVFPATSTGGDKYIQRH